MQSLQCTPANILNMHCSHLPIARCSGIQVRNSFEGRNSLGKLLNCFPKLELLVPKWGSIPAAHLRLISQQCTRHRMLPRAGMCSLDIFRLCTSLLTATSVSEGLNLRDCLQLCFSLPPFKTKTTNHRTTSYTRLQHPVNRHRLKTGGSGDVPS